MELDSGVAEDLFKMFIDLENVTIYTDKIINILDKDMNKICRICNKSKSINLFYKRHKDCIECWNLKRRMKYPLSVCKNCKIEFRPGIEGRYKFCSEQCRFLKKVIKEQKTGCWIWQAAIDKRSGYGRFQVNTENVLAHRVSYRLFKGSVKDDLYILHSCHRPICVAPDHLRLGTAMDNTNDRRNAGRTNAKPHTILNIKHMKEKLKEKITNGV